MGERDGSGPPAWLPASVGAAARRGTASESDLLSGRAWAGLLDALRRAGGMVAGDERVPGASAEQAAGYRHLLVLLALGIDEALRSQDPSEPRIRPGNVDSVLKWGMDCPDALYSGCSVRPDAVYRITGHRGSARYLGFQLMAGIETTANVVADELELGPDGTFELTVSTEHRPGNWMPLAEGASTLVVRQFFYDWMREEPARLSIECLSHPASGLPVGPSPAEALARRLEALGEFVDGSLRFWLDIDDMGRGQGVNAFRDPVVRTDIGGAEENVTVWGSWELEPDQALVIEVNPPPAQYWSLALGNVWWETLDYAGHQTSLNGHQAVVDDDGVFRAVVAHRDPGVANWLDTTGFRQGPMIVRWLRAEAAPVPECRVVAFDEIDAALPDHTTRVGPAERQRVLAGRRAGVARRFAR